jgi:hypothetical protein
MRLLSPQHFSPGHEGHNYRVPPATSYTNQCKVTEPGSVNQGASGRTFSGVGASVTTNGGACILLIGFLKLIDKRSNVLVKFYRRGRMQSVRFISGIATLLLFSTPIRSTTIIVTARNGQIYIGADGKRTHESESGPPGFDAMCKTKEYGTVVVAHSGGAAMIAVKQDGASTQMTTVYDADEIARKAVRVPGSVSDKADSLERNFWAVYKDLVSTVPNIPPGLPRLEWMNNLSENGFVVAGVGKSGLPEAVVLTFTTDFSKPVFRPRKERTWISEEGINEFYMGWFDALPKGDIDPFPGNVDKAIMGYLKAETRMHSSVVGPPYSLARVTKDGIVFDQKGACGQSQNHAQQLRHSAHLSR